MAWKARSLKQRTGNEFWTGLLFISPWLAGFLVWVLYPMAYSIFLSFCYYDGMRSPVFIGWENYREILSDGLLLKCLWNTLYITFLGVPLGILFSLALALLLNQKRKGISVYRTLVYLPCLTPVVAMTILWQWLFNPEMGLLNSLIRSANELLRPLTFGLVSFPVPGWLNDPAWAKPALIFMGLWGAGGTMLILLASLQDVPKALYESAEIDGAGRWHRHWNVTIPMISPVLLFNLIMGIIGGFQYFTQAYVISNGTGGPADSTLFYALYLFNNAFPDWRMGYASALAWILFFITLGFSILVFRSSARHVYYHGEA